MKPINIAFKAKSLIDIRELNEHNIIHENGYVTGSYIDGYIISGVVEANSEYISIGQWCPIDTSTLDIVDLGDVNDL